MEKPTQCGVSGKVFAEGDLYIEETIPATDTEQEYVRYIATEHSGLSEEEIQVGLEDGSVKRYGVDEPEG